MRLGYVVVQFESPFHVGRYSLMDALDYVPSDTVYSALEWLRHMGVGDMPARVSSAYPLLPAEGEGPTSPWAPRGICSPRPCQPSGDSPWPAPRR
jgi:hypothetical protein